MIPLPYRILTIVAVWIASLVAVGLWQRSDGIASISAKWQAREVAQQVQAASQYKALAESARAAEQKHSADMAAIATAYERKLTDATKQRIKALAAVRAGTLRLYDNAAIMPTCDGGPAKISPASGVGNGGTPSQLSGELAEFLIAEASRADEVANQLSACQSVVASDRK